MKLIKNARLWQTLAISLLLVSNLSGCAFWRDPVKPVEIIAKPVEKTPLAIAHPDPLIVKPIKWVVITPETANTVFSALEEKKQNLVLFALTDATYQQLSVMLADLRNFIATQRTIIIKYKEYYEPTVKPK
jgi:hypothetical protein|tara:strand:- start:7847 stop:8239 length:393 start_codon:yes stop_codon:yes gene_type:complete